MSKKDLKITSIIPGPGLAYLICFNNGTKRELDCYNLIKERPEFKILEKSKAYWFATVDRFQKKIEFTEKLSLTIEEVIKYSRLYDIEKENKKIIKMIYNLGKEERIRKKITQKQMAGMIGVPQSSIARLEKGDTDVQLSTILNYLSPLGLTLEIRSKDVPNKTTLKAMLEADEMENNPKKYKRYDSFSEILKEI